MKKLLYAMWMAFAILLIIAVAGILLRTEWPMVLVLPLTMVLIIVACYIIVALFLSMLDYDPDVEHKVKIPWTCSKLGWHKPGDNEVVSRGPNLLSHCSKCGNPIAMDSQGNWFYMEYQTDEEVLDEVSIPEEETK